MKSYLPLVALLAFTTASQAGDLRKGATMQVRPGSIWFQNRAALTQWQALKRAGDATALASYQDALLQAREAWQFTKPIAVRIRGYEIKADRVAVDMLTEGRLRGSIWLLDAAAIEQ